MDATVSFSLNNMINLITKGLRLFFLSFLKKAKIYSFLARTKVFTTKCSVFFSSPGIEWEKELCIIAKYVLSIYLRFKLNETSGFLVLGLSLEPDKCMHHFLLGFAMKPIRHNPYDKHQLILAINNAFTSISHNGK